MYLFDFKQLIWILFKTYIRIINKKKKIQVRYFVIIHLLNNVNAIFRETLSQNYNFI